MFVTSGNTNQRRCAVKAGDYLEWNFRELSEHSVDTAVYFVREGAKKGDEVAVRGMLRRKIDAQSFTATEAGELVFMFDNTFSWWTNKHISLEIKKQGGRAVKSAPRQPNSVQWAGEPEFKCTSSLVADEGGAMSPDVSEHAEAAVKELLRAEAEWAIKHQKESEHEPDPRLEPSMEPHLEPRLEPQPVGARASDES